MKWVMRWNPNDPLLTSVFQHYGYNLLNVPRQRASIGDVYRFDGLKERLSCPGRIRDLVDDKFQLPKITHNEVIPPIKGRVSIEKSLNFGMQFLDWFFESLGLGSMLSKISANYRDEKIENITFNFVSPVRDSVPVSSLGLRNRSFGLDNVFYRKGSRYYLVTSVIRSPSITIKGHYQGGSSVDLEAFTSIIKPTTRYSVTKEEHDEYTYRGKKKLVFAVELHEIMYGKNQIKDLRQPERPHLTKAAKLIAIDTAPALAGKG